MFAACYVYIQFFQFVCENVFFFAFTFIVILPIHLFTFSSPSSLFLHLEDLHAWRSLIPSCHLLVMSRPRHSQCAVKRFPRHSSCAVMRSPYSCVRLILAFGTKTCHAEGPFFPFAYLLW